MGEPVAHWIDRGAARTLCGRCVPPRLVHVGWRRCKTCEAKRKAEGGGYLTTFVNGWSRQRFENTTSAGAATWTITTNRTLAVSSTTPEPGDA